MEQPIIEVKNLGKRYSINHQRGGYIALRDVLATIFKSPLSFIKSRVKEIAGIQTKEEFWALKNVNFSVKKGEMIGIIGMNGAGKSTLLKVLSQITPPTTGEIKIQGRVGSLLEVGTGFHPELTGRENIFLNGAILGMGRKEIAKKFNQIVDFSGVDKFLDTPVKYYSSGMYVRLAFSVAAHMEPDILIVDEVLAVGDAEFQKKCLGKMEEVTQKEGRTILFVSHNLGAIQSLCSKAILLEKGEVKMFGKTSDVIDAYMHEKPKKASDEQYHLHIKEGSEIGKITFTDILITDSENSSLIHSHSNLKIVLKYESSFKQEISDIRVLMSITSERSQRIVLRLDSHGTLKTLGETIAPQGEIVCETDAINLAEGKYLVEILILPQKAKGSRLQMTAEFEVVTDISKYGYRLNPDKNVCDHLIRYAFTQ